MLHGQVAQMFLRYPVSLEVEFISRILSRNVGALEESMCPASAALSKHASPLA